MKNIKIIIKLFIALYCLPCSAQDTFSIVAVDSLTGEVGSAGASCIAGSVIISDVHPGKGAIHTQAWYFQPNQANAKNIMDTTSYTPQEIINWLVANDMSYWSGGTLYDSSYRQYGIVRIDSLKQTSSAGYTGVNTNDYKGHKTGANYSIQGNILLGPQILDSMEARFINTSGDLPCKLMSALQGANVPGADTRCLSINTSSKSSFIRIANNDSLFINLNVNSVPISVEPIDSVQKLFNAVYQPKLTYSYSTSGKTVNFTGFSPGATGWAWNFGDSATSVLQNPNHTYSNEGTYQVCITVTNACGFKIVCDSIILKTNGIGKSELTEQNILNCRYNSNHIFTISLPGQRISGILKVYNLLGEEIIEQSISSAIPTFSIDMSSFPEGIYFVKITDSSGIFTGKINNF